MITKTAIAEQYLGLLKQSRTKAQAGMYVRLAAKYGVNVGRIINLTGLPADVVIAYLEDDN